MAKPGGAYSSHVNSGILGTARAARSPAVSPPFDWFNHRRLHETCGDIPPAELEAAHYRQRDLTEAGHSSQ